MFAVVGEVLMVVAERVYFTTMDWNAHYKKNWTMTLSSATT
jgi:hypothetical protein